MQWQDSNKAYSYFYTYSKEIAKDVGLKVFVNESLGTIGNCWKRFQRNWTTKLMEDESFTDPIPSNKTDFANLVLAHPDYKDRATKEEKELTQLVLAT